MKLFNSKRRQTDSNSKLDQLKRLIGEEDAERLNALIADEQGIPPKIAVIGKAGVGKTTTINNLFNAEWKTSHVVAGTKEAQKKVFELAGGGELMIFDMPGLGEDLEADAIYEGIYREVLPDMDVVLWVMQANSRGLAEDQRILKEIVLDSLGENESRLVIGLNQVDKLGPGQWNEKLNYPSEEQAYSISRKCADIAEKLSGLVGVDKDQIQYFSALRRYRLYDLLTALIGAADSLGWKLPIQPRNPFELADPEVQEFVKQYMKTQ